MIDKCKLILPQNVDSEDLHWMQKALLGSRSGTTPLHSFEDLKAGRVMWWRLMSGDFQKGILETQVQQHPAGRELYITSFGGEGVIGSLERIVGLLECFGRGVDCRWMSANSYDAKLSKIYERRAGLPIVGTIHTKELSRGN